MIQATELQLGNVIYFPFIKKYVTVVGLPLLENDKKIRIQTAVCGNQYFFELPVKYSPVKLTEEQILKLDFCKDNSENNKTYISPIHNGIVMKIYFNRFGIPKLFVGNNTEIEIPYVHTLQNVYSLFTAGGKLVFLIEE